jgi:hypothetical protein
MTEKTCRICKALKPINKFNKAPGNKDGYNNSCKTCQKEYTKKYHEKQKTINEETGISKEPKICPRCKKLKSADCFHKNTSSKTGLTSFCKPCSSAKGKEWNQKNKEKLRHKSREKDLKRNYGLTLQEYHALLREQNGKCDICGSTNPGKNKKYFPVDHCHLTGKVRGLLCGKCNCALGFLNDDLKLLEKAVDYLKKHHDPDLI